MSTSENVIGNETLEAMVKGMEGEFAGRESYVEMLKRRNHPKALTDRAHAITEFREFLSKKLVDAPDAKSNKHMDKRAVEELSEALATAKRELLECATEENGHYTPNGSSVEDIEKFASARGKLDAAEANLKNFLSGSKKHKIGDLEYAASSELKAAYGKVKTTSKSVSNLFDGLISDLKIWGPESTLKRNLGLGEEIAEGAKTKIGFRWGGVAVGAAMAGDAIVRGQKADGDKRSMYERMAELAAGVGIAGASAFAGAAR